MPKQRLDVLLVERHLCETRQQAQRLIRAGAVRVNQQVMDKPGTEVDVTVQLEVKQKAPYVSRGGEKLAKAIAEFHISVSGRICLDGGISTGGFTDCLLQAGAARVYGIDVGYGQVAWSLRQDPRVILFERTNLRSMEPATLYQDDRPWADLGVIDVSFIALAKVLPACWSLLQPPKEAVLLVKPQFEVGRERVGKNGVVRHPQDQAIAILQVWQAAQAIGWRVEGVTWSPLLGPAGNIEYLLWLQEHTPGSQEQQTPELKSLVELAQTAQRELKRPDSGVNLPEPELETVDPAEFY